MMIRLQEPCVLPGSRHLSNQSSDHFHRIHTGLVQVLVQKLELSQNLVLNLRALVELFRTRAVSYDSKLVKALAKAKGVQIRVFSSQNLDQTLSESRVCLCRIKL